MDDPETEKEQPPIPETQSKKEDETDRIEFTPDQISNTGFMNHKFCEKARDFAWENPDSYKEADRYFSAFDTILQPKNNSGILFAVIQTWFEWKQPRYNGFVNWIGKGPYRALLSNKKPTSRSQDSNPTPLIFAISERKAEFVTAFLQLDGKVLNTLYKVKGYGTCLHEAIIQESSSIEQMAEKFRDNPDLFLELNDEKNNILHLLAQTNGDELLVDNSKYIVGLREATADADTGRSKGAIYNTEFQNPNLRLRVLQLVMDSLHMLDVRPLQAFNENNLTPYQLRVATLHESEHVRSVLDEFSKPKEATSFQKMKEQKKTPNDKLREDKLREHAFRKIVDKDPIAKFIRIFCIRKFKNSHDCSKALYKPGNGEPLLCPAFCLPTFILGRAESIASSDFADCW